MAQSFEKVQHSREMRVELGEYGISDLVQWQFYENGVIVDIIHWRSQESTSWGVYRQDLVVTLSDFTVIHLS